MVIILGLQFKDYFSEGSDAYSRFRPNYPKALFSYLSTLTQCNDRAWDCATGSGQSALALSEYFTEVIGTDASKNQIDHAIKKPGITYQVETAEQTSISSHSIELITVAQALHWFNINKFSNEVLRVLKPKGVLAAWTYGLFDIYPELNKVIHHLYSVMLDPYWPPERRIVERGYKDIIFPLDEITPPAFQMTVEWDLSQLLGYLCTWSAVKQYENIKGNNPVEAQYETIADLWGDPECKRLIQWPLTLRVWVKNT